MIQFKRLDHVLITIPEGKTDEARAFYGNLLGLTEIDGGHPHGALWFTMGDIELHIREEGGSGLSSRHPAFEVSNLSEARQFLESNAVALSYSTEIEGRQRFFFRDPFGNRFELLEFAE